VEGGPRSRVIPQIMTEAMQHFALDVGATTEPPVCAVTYGSEISNTIVDYARKQGARMVVLGVRQASLLGSHGPAPISYRVIAEAGCPVLTVSFDQKTAARLEADGCEHFAN
jgi:nucleotide-binding universal stress UspA family protein